VATPKVWKNALAMLPHLAKCAKERRTITYGELGALIGVPAFFMGQSLDVLRDQLLPRHNLPRIDALVVSKDSGEAGDSFFQGGRDALADEEYRSVMVDQREQVYAYPNWDTVVANLIAHYGD